MYLLNDLTTLLQCLDLTSLEGLDNQQSILELVDDANKGINDNYVAAVCVYPNFGNLVRSNLKPSIKTAVVGGCFPSGQTTLEAKVAELQSIQLTNVDEVDIVINRGALFGGDYDLVHAEIAAMRNAIPNKLLKVILETGELKDKSLIKKSAEIAIKAGADFIKTSTGKSGQGATQEAVELMCLVIKAHVEATGKKIGIKPSGGIREVDDALAYKDIVKRVLGDEWIQPDYFRIGASTLYKNLIHEITGIHA